MHSMKKRITLTMDPKVSVQARHLAKSRHTSVSALVESLVSNAARRADIPDTQESFADRWRGKLRLAPRHGARFEWLKRKYRL